MTTVLTGPTGRDKFSRVRVDLSRHTRPAPRPSALEDVLRVRRVVAGDSRCDPREAPFGGEDEGERRGSLGPAAGSKEKGWDLFRRVRVVEGGARLRVRRARRRLRAAGGDERPRRGDPREHARSHAAEGLGEGGGEAMEQRAHAATLWAPPRVVLTIHRARVHVRGSLGRGAGSRHARHHRRGRRRRRHDGTRGAHVHLRQTRALRHDPRQAPHLLRAHRQQQRPPLRLPRPARDRADDARHRRPRRRR